MFLHKKTKMVLKISAGEADPKVSKILLAIGQRIPGSWEDKEAWLPWAQNEHGYYLQPCGDIYSGHMQQHFPGYLISMGKEDR